MGRKAIPWKDIPHVVQALHRSPIYRSGISPQAFPRDFKEFSNISRLANISLEAEFIWTASVVSLHSTAINSFLQIQKLFDNAFIRSDYPLAEKLLDDVQEKHGVSIWLMSRRLQLLQLQKGLAAQKAYLEETIYVPSLNTFGAWLAYYFSLRSEENVSYSALLSEIEELLNVEGDLADFVRYHVLPTDLERISNTELCINWSEPHPIIDRYITWKCMSQVHMARHGTQEFMRACFSTLKDIDDDQLDALRSLWEETKKNKPLDSSIALYDAYQEGRYLDILHSASAPPELAARALAMVNSENIPLQNGSLLDQILNSMKAMLLLDFNYQAAFLHLRKISLICAGMPIATEVMSFLKRSHDNIPPVTYSFSDRLGALQTGFDNPWNQGALSAIAGKKLQIGNENSSSTIKLLELLRANDRDGISKIEAIALPPYRTAMHKGHLAFRAKNFEGAAKFYGEALEDSPSFVQSRAQEYLFRSVLANKEILQAVKIAAQHCIARPSAYRVYPLAELLPQALASAETKGAIELAVLLHLASRNIHPKWERDLSDVYENVLAALNVFKPSELIGIEAQPSALLIFFLRHICVPRVLDDSVEFDSIEEIENERILLCQALVEIDPNAKTAYEEEIKTITREATIHKILQQVESSKIFVDEDGVTASLEDSLRPAFSRYKKLLDSPILSYQAEKITKRIGELLGDHAPPDLKNIRIPTSERESLFIKLLESFVDRFALNPAYGLDTHLSTTIRHGAFEGHIRAPAASRDLLLTKDPVNQTPILGGRFARVENISLSASTELTALLANFTNEFTSTIDLFHRDRLRVLSDVQLNGLFSFQTSLEERSELMNSISETTTYEDLLARLFNFSWKLTERSLANIRGILQGKFLRELTDSIDKLLSSIESSRHYEELSFVSNLALTARTEIQAATEHVCSWFNLPRDLTREAFEIDLAIDVARRQVQNCYVKTKLEPKIDIRVFKHIRGEHLDGLVEVLFILFQNVVLRSGYFDAPCDVKISAVEDGELLTIKVSNRLSNDINLASRRTLADEAVRRYEHDTAMKFARLEGGSGLSKVWRIFEYDIRRQHRLKIEVTDDKIFSVILEIHDLWKAAAE